VVDTIYQADLAWLLNIQRKLYTWSRDVLRGWRHFCRHCYNAKTVFSRVDHYVWDRLRRWLRRKYPTTPALAIRRQFWRRLGHRPRFCWMDRHPVFLLAHICVERHNLASLHYPDYASNQPESPVHHERCTPGLGTGAGETTPGNCGTGAPAPCSLTPKGAAS
jgi:RNA-directed DNA polymerase